MWLVEDNWRVSSTLKNISCTPVYRKAQGNTRKISKQHNIYSKKKNKKSLRVGKVGVFQGSDMLKI